MVTVKPSTGGGRGVECGVKNGRTADLEDSLKIRSDGGDRGEACEDRGSRAKGGEVVAVKKAQDGGVVHVVVQGTTEQRTCAGSEDDRLGVPVRDGLV